MKVLIAAACLLIFVRLVQGVIFECRSGHPMANSYCSDYCRSLHPGNHLAGSCAQDEVSCLCETSNGRRIKVRIMQDQQPVPHASENEKHVSPELQPEESGQPIRIHRRPQQLPLRHRLNCDGTPVAEATCNSFCIEIVRGSGGSCNADNLTCRCRDVPHLKNEPIPAVYIPLGWIPPMKPQPVPALAPLEPHLVPAPDVPPAVMTTTSQPISFTAQAELIGTSGQPVDVNTIKSDLPADTSASPVSTSTSESDMTPAPHLIHQQPVLTQRPPLHPPATPEMAPQIAQATHLTHVVPVPFIPIGPARRPLVPPHLQQPYSVGSPLFQLRPQNWGTPWQYVPPTAPVTEHVVRSPPSPSSSMLPSPPTHSTTQTPETTLTVTQTSTQTSPGEPDDMAQATGTTETPTEFSTVDNTENPGRSEIFEDSAAQNTATDVSAQTTTTETAADKTKFSPPPIEYTGWRAIKHQKRMQFDPDDLEPSCTVESCGVMCEQSGLAHCAPVCLPQGCFCSCPRINAHIPNYIARATPI